MSAIKKLLPKTTARFAVICVLLSSILFSAKAIVVKIALLGEPMIDGVGLLALRMGVALPYFLGLVWFTRGAGKVTARVWVQIIAAGVLGYYLASVLDFIGLEYISASLERIILFLYPTFAVLFGVIFLGDRLKAISIFGLILGYVGTLIVMLGAAAGIGAQSDLIKGSVLVLISAAAYAGYLVLAEPVIKSVGQWRATGLILSVSSIACLIHAGITVPLSEVPVLLSLPTLGYGILLGIFATVIPVSLVIYGIRQIGAAQSAMISAGGPVLTLFLAAIFLDESLSWVQWIGAAANIAGVMTVSLSVRSKQTAPLHAQSSVRPEN